MSSPYAILADKRLGRRLDTAAIAEVVAGATDGSWSDAQLGAFLMAAAIRGLDLGETRDLTLAMLHSGELWELSRAHPGVGDKHSTGGVGDKVSLILAPLLASCGLPVAMLTGRGLGHTGGTADKLECVPGIDLELDRSRTLALLGAVGMALGVATRGIAPADRKLYSLRDVTATVDSLPLIVASILSKKLATGAAAVIFDVKTGDGAFLPELSAARELARLLVETSRELGVGAAARLTDMSQPLGEWSGHTAEMRETYDCLEGRGPADTLAVTFDLALGLARLLGRDLERADLEAAIASGRARAAWVEGLAAHGGDRRWLESPSLPLAPVEVPIESARAGVLARIRTRRLGQLLVEAGAGRRVPSDRVDLEIALRTPVKVGAPVESGQELARLYLRRPDPGLVESFRACFEVHDSGTAPELLGELI